MRWRSRPTLPPKAENRVRYRPFRLSGVSVSAVSLGPTDPAMSDDEREQLYQAALMAGVNTFEVGAGDTAAQTMLGDALRSYDRSLVMASVRVGSRPGPKGDVVHDFSPARIMAEVGEATRRLDLGALDLVMLDNPTLEDLTPELVESLRQAHTVGLFGAIGVRSEGAGAEQLVRCGAFKVLSTRFNLLSGWPERNLIRLAVEHGMTVTGYGYTGGELQAGDDQPVRGRRGFLGFGRKKEAGSALSRGQGYRFLSETNGWSDEAICLAYALTEPALATVQVDARSVQRLQDLAAAPERDLPSSVSAQIEMARFAAVA